MEKIGDFYLDIPPGAFPLSTDTMALADFVRLGPGETVLDLGSGCGSLGLLLCSRRADCHVTGLELDPAAHEAAVENIRRNGLEGHMASICTDLRQVSRQFPAGSFSACVSNPPYFSGGPASKAGSARREDQCSLPELFTAAAWALRWGGRFYLVHRPERLAQLCACAVQACLEPKRLRLLRHRPEAPVSLVLLECRKGGKPGLLWEEQCLYGSDGSPSPDFQRIYHL